MIREIQCADEQEWLETRRTIGIGASDAAAILGVSHWKSPYQLWHEKLGLQVVSEEETEAQEWGKTLEEPLARKYARVTKREVAAPRPWLILQDEDHPWMFATLDRKIRCPDLPDLKDVWLSLELKTAHWLLAGNWAEEPPLDYLVQVQHQLAVTGLPMGSMGALVGGQLFLWCDIKRDDDFIAQLREHTRLFWESLQAGIPPPVDGTASTRATLKALYSREKGGEVVALGGDAIQWDQDLTAIKARIKETIAPLNQEEARLENLFIAAIGLAPAATLPNGVVYTYKTTDRAGYVVNPCSYRTLRRKGGRKT